MKFPPRNLNNEKNGKLKKYHSKINLIDAINPKKIEKIAKSFNVLLKKKTREKIIKTKKTVSQSKEAEPNDNPLKIK